MPGNDDAPAKQESSNKHLKSADSAMTDAGSKVLLAVHTLRVIVTWTDGSIPDPFLAKMTVRLRRDGASGAELPQATDSKPGRLTFDVPDDVTLVRLEVDTPSPNPSLFSKHILDFFQEAKIDRSGPVPRLEATKSANATGPTTRTSTTHPRVLLKEQPPNSGKWFFALDLRFLNVSDYVASLSNAGFGNFRAMTLACKWFVFAHTRGVPLVWAVGVPTAVGQGEASVNSLLYLQHELSVHRDTSGTPVNDGYTTLEDCDYGRLTKYMAMPNPPVGRYINNKGLMEVYPLFGWDKQLDASGRKVVFVMPFPQGKAGVNFGAIAGPADASNILASLFRALQADGLVAGDTEDKTQLARLAIGGWSSGTTQVMIWVDADNSVVDELYLFDGFDDVATRLMQNGVATMRTWLAKKSGRLLRMIGTSYTEVAYNSVAAGLKNPNATSRPNDTTYWYNDPFYKQALSQEGHPIVALDKLGSPASTEATLSSQIFLAPPGEQIQTTNGVTTCTLTLGGNDFKTHAAFTTASLSIMSQTEAAAFLLSDSGGLRANDQAGFNSLTSGLGPSGVQSEPNRVKRLRHPWSVFGGTGPSFKGFFQICLEESGFPR